MFTRSIWNAYEAEGKYGRLSGDITVDVAIVGGGITGITTAMLLKEKGLKIAVLESREVGKGTSSHSTGNLYAITDQLLDPIKSKYDEGTVKKVVNARQNAVGLIERTVSRFQLDCDFTRQPQYLFDTGDEKNLEQEKEIAVASGLKVSEISGEFPVEFRKGIRIEDQAQFNPLRYVQSLANKIQGDNCSIYEYTRVGEIEERENGFLLHTTAGKVTAKFVVQATHTPKGVELQYHTVLGPYREYGIAAKLRDGNYPEGIFWGYFKGEKISFRSYRRGEESYLLCIGKPHKVGQAGDNQEYINELIDFAEKRFPVQEISYKWGGQHYKPADLLPYIGRKTDGSNEFIATGFSTDGLVYGTLSALIISDAINGVQNPYEDLVKASRHNPGKAAKKFAKENIDVASQLVKDWLFQGDNKDLQAINPGEARIVNKDKEKVAVYRTPGGELKAFSAVCTHMGCIVNWNNAEKSWDCPCHGTRFDVEGEVLEGPAFDPLEKINNKKEDDDER